MSSSTEGMPVTSLIFCFLVLCLFLTPLYVIPLIFGRFGWSEQNASTSNQATIIAWTRLGGLVMAALLSIALARLAISLAPLEKPNNLSIGQILGISPNVDSVWWDVMLPLLITLILLLPLMATNVLVEMATLAVGSKTKDRKSVV